MSPPLSDWIPRLSEARVALVGDLVLDTYVYGLSDRISREAPVVVVRETDRQHLLGGAANVAANLRALGAGCSAVGLVGRDEDGATVERLLRELGADVAGVVASDDRATETKTRILAGGPSTTPQQVLRLDRGGSPEPLPRSVLDRLRDRIEAAARDADVVVVSDYGLGVLAPQVVRGIRALGRRVPVLVDSRFDLTAWEGVTLVKPNVPEIEAATGRSVSDPASAARVARLLARRLGVEQVLVTLGHQGLTLVPAQGRGVHLPVFGPPEAVDVTGAGDAVMATFAAALGAGAPPETAAELANVAGGLVVQKPGTATASAAELVHALRGAEGAA